MVDIVDSRHVVLPGKPLPKERPRLFRGRAITPAKTLDYERQLREAYLAVHGRKPVFTDDVEIDVLAAVPNKTHGDLDNIVKMVDGLNGIAWVDDKLIKRIHAHLIFDKANPRFELTIRPYQPA